MSTQRYSVTPHPIETLLTWVKSGEIAIPEILSPSTRLAGESSSVQLTASVADCSHAAGGGTMRV